MLGVWLALAGFAWVILSLTGVLSPQYYDKVFTFTQPAVFGEIAFMFWLLIKVSKPPALDTTALSSAAAQAQSRLSLLRMRHPRYYGSCQPVRSSFLISRRSRPSA